MVYEPNGMYSVEKVLSTVCNEIKKESQNRYCSWEYCYSAFSKVAKKGYESSDTEYLALHLAGYLASWGMYRGSSALLKNYHYLIHKDLIQILYAEEYLPLFSVDETNYKTYLHLIDKVYSQIEQHYSTLRAKEKQLKPSATLITKIMLGVYGCVPAYDRFFNKGLRHYAIQQNGKNKFHQLCNWLEENNDFEKDVIAFREKKLPNHRVNYPFMKVVDMYFWGLGKVLAEEENKKELKG